MFGFGKKESIARKEFREEFEGTIAKLRSAPEISQIAVGHAINLAHSLFAQTFGTPANFSTQPANEQASYIERLTTMENRFRDEKNDMASSLGFGLFKMWVGTLHANDAELQAKFAQELAYFSRKGDLGGAVNAP